jgi:hypothetical protein
MSGGVAEYWSGGVTGMRIGKNALIWFDLV